MTWQPIETAPKDGTCFDAWTAEGRITDVFWGLTSKAWCRWECENGFGYIESPITPPTHWMPLPSAPEKAP